MNTAITHGLRIAGAAWLVFTSFLVAYSQGETDATRRENERDLEQRVFDLSLLRTRKPTTKNSNSPELMAQVQNDFTRIQVVDNDLAEALDRKGALDLNFVAKSVAEIEQLATRLMNNLTHSKPGKKSKGPDPETTADRDQLRQSLAVLDKLVVDFAHNPVFREASPDDAKLGAKALRDLDQIIVVSGQARKSAENLIKEIPQSP
jgi:hypothetical protein